MGVRRSPATRPQRVAISILGCLGCAVIPLEMFTSFAWRSDDVAWQVALRTWRPGVEHLAIPENTYVIRIPLLLLVDWLTPSGVWQLAATSLVLNGIAFLLVRGFGRAVMAASLGCRPSELSIWAELAVAGAAVMPLIFSEALRLSNAGLTTRNLETGIYLLVLRLALEVATCQREFGSTRDIVKAAVVVGVLSLNDPLFVASIVAPGSLLLIVSIALGRYAAGAPWRIQCSRLLFSAILGMGFWLMARRCLELASVKQQPSGVSLTPSQVANNAANLLRVIRLAGGASPNAGDPTTIQLIAIVSGSIGLALAVTVIAMARRHGRLGQLWMAWFAVLCLLFVLSSAGQSVAGFRYVSVGLGGLPVVAAAVWAKKAYGTVATVTLAALLSCMAAIEASVERHGHPNDGIEQLALAVDGVAERSGITIGYAGYWAAHVSTYLNSAGARVLGVRCDSSGSTIPFDWLADMSQFSSVERAQRSRSGTFYVIDRTPLATGCDPELIAQQFGEPSYVVLVGSPLQYELWVWPYDIGSSISSEL